MSVGYRFVWGLGRNMNLINAMVERASNDNEVNDNLESVMKRLEALSGRWEDCLT